MLDRKSHILAISVSSAAIAAATALFGAGISGAATKPDSSWSITSSVDPLSAAAARGLLSSRQMPKVNEVQQWTRLAEPRNSRISVTQKGRLASLAPGHARRDFWMPGGRASNVVLNYRRRAAATEGYKTVLAWRSNARAGLPDGAILLYRSPYKTVSTPYGEAAYFQITWKSDPSAEEGWFEWVGVTRRGHKVSIVTWRIGGTDANYETDPTIATLKTANRMLGRV
jgi:hypothetical protein